MRLSPTRDATHKLTTAAVKTYRLVGIRGFERVRSGERQYRQSVLEKGFYEIRRQLEYQVSLVRIALIVTGRWFASSKPVLSLRGGQAPPDPRALSVQISQI